GTGGRGTRCHLGSPDNRPRDHSEATLRWWLRALISPAIAYADRKFDSPSRKIEFYSSQAMKLGLPPVHKADKVSPYPLALSFGRTLIHFHSFYDETGAAIAGKA